MNRVPKLEPIRWLLVVVGLQIATFSYAQVAMVGPGDTAAYEHHLEGFQQTCYVNIDSARLHLDSMNQSVTRISDSLYHSFNDMSNGSWHWVAGNLDSSLWYAFRSLRIAEDHHYLHIQDRAMNLIGIIYIDLAEWELAETFQRRSLEVSRIRKNRYSQLINFTNLSVIYDKTEQYDLGLQHVKQSIFMADSIGDFSSLALAYQSKSSIFSGMGQSDSAIHYGLRAIRLAQDANDRKAEIHSWLKTAKGYRIRQQWDSVQYCASEALNHSLAMDFIEGQRDAHQLLKEVYSGIGNHKEALLHAEKEKYLDDSLYSLQRINHIKSMEKKQVEEQARSELLESKGRWQSGLMGLMALAGILLLLGSILLFRYRSTLAGIRRRRKNWEKERSSHQHHMDDLRQNNQQLHEQLMQKEKDLLAYTLELERKQKIIQQVETKLTSGGPRAEEVIELKAFLKSAALSESEWNEFDLRFEAVHESFFNTLNRHYSGLTSTDLKICAFIKMNLSSKQIASLLNIAPQSVDMARYRLRKKLGLSKKDNLIEVINRI